MATAETGEMAAGEGADYDTTLEVAKPTISQAALDKYGATEIDKATSLVADIVDEYGYNDALVLAKRGENLDTALAAANDMTPQAAHKWTSAVRDFSSNDDAKIDAAAPTVFSYSLYSPNNGGNGVYPPKSGPAVVNKAVRGMEVTLEPDGRLVVRADATGDLRVVAKSNPRQPGKSQLLPFNRDTTYWMVRTGQGWKVDTWDSDMTTGQYRADN